MRDDGPVDLGYHVRDFDDTDGDGMPDVWEQYFGLNANVNDATGDLDGDTLNNLTEFQRGTKPSAIDTDLDVRSSLGGDEKEAFVWQYNWSTPGDFTLARDIVDPLRRFEFYFGGNLADFKGVASQRGGPIQTVYAATSATFTWETGIATTNDLLYYRASDASNFGGSVNASGGTIHTATVASGLGPGNLFFGKAVSNGNLLGKPFAFYTKPDLSTLVVERGPYLQNPKYVSATGKSEITVMWRTSQATTGNVVRYRQAGQSEQVSAADTNPQNHEIRLTGLTQGAYYTYRVESSLLPVQSEHTFRAFQSAPQKVTVGVYGDNRAEGADEYSFAHGRVAESILGLAQAPDLDFLVNMGEAYRGFNTSPNPNPHLFWPARDLLASLPFFVAVGDLEYEQDPSLLSFNNFFDYPSPAGFQGTTFHPFYSFDYGDCHFIVLDTGAAGDYKTALTHEGVPGIDTQHEWLLQDLKAATSPRNKWICVFLHKPGVTDTIVHPWSQAEIQEIRDGTGTTLEAFGVDLVFQGHSHAYERFKYSFTDPTFSSTVHDDFGVQYIVTGGGGALPQDVLLASPTAGAAGRKRGLTTYNSCVLSVTTGGNLEVKASELGGPGLLDVLTLTRKWPHPKVTLIGKYEVPTSDTYKWHYFQGASEPPSWNYFSFNDSTWTLATVGGQFGFGDGDEDVPMSAAQSTYLFRRKFTLPSGSILPGDIVELRVVVDDGCDVYLSNASSLPSLVASVPLINRDGYQERQWHFLRISALSSSSPPGDWCLAVRAKQADALDLSFWAELVVKTPSP